MPMALCTPDTSILAGIKDMVASPGLPPDMTGGIQNLIIESGFFGENSRNAWTREGSKNLKLRILLAAADSAIIVVIGEVGSNWRKVASWQWSGLSCEMSTTFGSGICERFWTQEGLVWRERRNLGCHIVEGPDIQGSIRMEKVPGGC